MRASMSATGAHPASLRPGRCREKAATTGESFWLMQWF